MSWLKEMIVFDFDRKLETDAANGKRQVMSKIRVQVEEQ